MRFTWMEAACILTIAIAALTQSGDRGARLGSPQVSAPRASIVADLKPSQRQGNANERTHALAGR
jgi:hypothetical protein